jgi:hypothetical protein
MLITSQKSVAVEQKQSADKFEVLRAIIIKQESREVGHDEAREIGESLLDFYCLLADEAPDGTDD